MAIIIKTTKTTVAGQKGRWIDKVDALTFKQLPKKYIEGRPCVYLRGIKPPRLYLRNKKDFFYSMQVGVFYSESHFQQMLKVIRDAGNRLHQMNKWEGEETFKI